MNKGLQTVTLISKNNRRSLNESPSISFMIYELKINITIIHRQNLNAAWLLFQQIDLIFFIKKQRLKSFKIQTILLLMKNLSTPFQRMGFEEDSDLQDIFKRLIELDKMKATHDSHHEHSNKSAPTKKKDNEPLISEDSSPQPTFSFTRSSPQVKKTYASGKSNDLVITVQPLKTEMEFSINHQSNISAESIQEEVDIDLQAENIAIMQRQNYLFKNTSEKCIEKEKTVDELKKQLQELRSKYEERQKTFQLQKTNQKNILTNILRQSNTQALKYYDYLEHIDEQRKAIINKEVISKNSTLLKILKEEQSKYKPRKKIKNAQTMSLSDQEEQKLSQFMQKEKKYYFSVIGSKIEKIRQNFETCSLNLNETKVHRLPQQKIQSLIKLQEMKDILPLTSIQSSNPNVQQILGINLEKCIEVRMQSVKFNPTLLPDQRSKIFDKFLEQASSGKKIAGHPIFNQKSYIFIPLSQISMTDQQILLVNECNYDYFSLKTFLNRIQMSPPEQQLHIVRYIVRICLKGMQEINNQLKHDKFVILPFNFYFNERWQLKLSNISLNQLLFQHFRHIFNQDDGFYFPPEEKSDKHAVCMWSLGILTYFLSFGGKPFQKYQPYHWNSRQEFFMFNELQTPQKTSSYDKCKDFIIYCLNKKGSINFNEVCMEPFLSQVK